MTKSVATPPSAERSAPAKSNAVRSDRSPSASKPVVNQCTAVGNLQIQRACKECAKDRPHIQPPDDPLEREADEVANRVMRKEAAPSSVGSVPSSVPASTPHFSAAARSKVNSVVSSPGQPLDAATRSFVEPRFGRDFSHVRVHHDTAAARSAQAVNAHAYTAGNHIAFAPGQYAPDSNAGKRLLAHELTHTVQQNSTFGNGLLQRSEDPDFSGVTDAEINASLDGMETPGVTGGSRPRIDDHSVPTRQRPRLDVQDLQRLPGETLAQALNRVRSVVGQRISDVPSVRGAWERARSQVLEQNELTSSNYSELYDATRRRFWQEVRNDPGAMRAFTDAGFTFPENSTTAPLLNTANPDLAATEIRVSLDHIQEKAIGENWRLALDADNLRMEFAMPNTYREIIQARHPELREATTPEGRPGTRVGMAFEVTNSQALPNGNVASDVTVRFGAGSEQFRQGSLQLPEEVQLRVTTTESGGFVAAETALGETTPLTRSLGSGFAEAIPPPPAGSGGLLTGGLRFLGEAFLAYAIADIATTENQEERVRKESHLLGGIAAGELGSYLMCNLFLGLETAGASILICGLVVGVVAGAAGAAAADVLFDETIVNSDDDARNWIYSRSAANLSSAPIGVKVTLIRALMQGWISGADVDAMVTLLNSVQTSAEMRRIESALEPFIVSDMSSIGQRTQLRVALARL
jgi:hypothetical protein